MHEYTSDEIASIASRGLRDPASLTLKEIQAVSGTALTQVRPKLAPPANALMFWSCPPPVSASKNLLAPYSGTILEDDEEPTDLLAQYLRRGG